jgi:hypothetical protein
MTNTRRPASERLRPLTDSYRFALYAPAEFRSPDATNWLAFVCGHGSAAGPGAPEHDWMNFRCMRSGQRATFPLNGSWQGRRVEWEQVERELGIQDPNGGGPREIRWHPSDAHLEFSTLARAVYDLARERDLPDEGEIGLIARELDWRAARNPAISPRYGQASFAGDVLDLALPGLVEMVCDGNQTRIKQGEPKSPARALRAAVDAAAKAQMHLPRREGPLDPILTPAQTWKASGWSQAARDLDTYIERVCVRFAARAEGERDGQGVLFNSLTLAA